MTHQLYEAFWEIVIFTRLHWRIFFFSSIFVYTALLLASFECEPPENPEEKERLKQLQDEVNLLLHMTNEVRNLVVPSTSTGLTCSSHPFLSSQPQPYVLVSTTVDSCFPAIFLDGGQIDGQIETSSPQNLQVHQVFSPLNSPSSSGTFETNMALEKVSEDANEDAQQGEDCVPSPPPPLNNPS